MAIEELPPNILWQKLKVADEKFDGDGIRRCTRASDIRWLIMQ
jgi:hypothetical protein